MLLDDGISDIVNEGFVAGIRLGQLVAPDMAARLLTPPSARRVVGSPEYLTRYGTPWTPDDLAHHKCIDFRRPKQETLYRCGCVENGTERHIPSQGKLTFNDTHIKLEAARRGLGLAYEMGQVVAEDIRQGTLVSVLDTHLPSIPGFHNYHPSRAQIMLKRPVFTDFAVWHLFDGASRYAP